MAAFRLFAVLATVFMPCLALAHVSSQVFTMLLPTDLYVAGGMMTVVLTLAWLWAAGDRAYRLFEPRIKAPTRSSSHSRRDHLPTWRAGLGLALWSALIFVGLFGPHGPRDNLLPVFFWEVFWPCAVVVAPVWTTVGKWLDPWNGALRLLQRLGVRAGRSRLRRRWRGVPACISAVAVALYMLADLSPNDPSRLAVALLIYGGIHLLGAVAFGRRWLLFGEAFGLTLALVSRLRILTRRGGRRHWQWPGTDLVRRRQPAVGHGLLVLTTLAIGSFDSLNETFWWLAKLKINPLLVPGRSALARSNAVATILSPGLVLILFASLVWSGAQWAKLPLSRATLSTLAISCLPIAWGYHLAHYASVAMVGYQYLLVGISDPFGTGLNWLGLDRHFVSTGFFFTPSSARRLFELQAAAVVVGHALSLVMAHAVTTQWAGQRERVFRASLPLALFMVIYTLFGLWLLASPKA